jgi:glycosyltransferase involved in cell wall biosynthesis
MVLGSLDTFLEAGRSDLRIGRLSANAGLLKALLDHGSFRELRLFCPTVAERERLRTELEAWLPSEQRARLRLGLQVELPAALGQGAVDVFHSCGWSRYLPGLARMRAEWAPSPVPLTGIVHSLNGPEMPARVRDFVDAPFLPCDALFCSSRAGLEVVRRQTDSAGGYAGRLEPVPLGIGEEFFRLPDKEEARDALGLGEEFVLLWLGRISASTKADLAPLIYAFRQVRTSVPSVRLLLAGGCEEGSFQAFRGVIDELGLGDCVHLLRDPTDGDRAALYAASDAFVSPVDNHQETFGLAVVEAMAAGLPCIVSDWDGYKDLVEEGITGFRIPTWWNPPSRRAASLRDVLEPDLAQLSLSQGVAVDLETLAERMLDLVRNPETARAMGEAGRTRARARFHWKAVVHRTEELWEGLRQYARPLSVPPPTPSGFTPWEVFSGYATGRVEAQDRLSISALGREILAGAVPMPATWTDLLPLSEGRLMNALVYGLAGNPSRSLAQLRLEHSIALGLPEDEVEGMVLWLLKYGVLRRDPVG